MAKKKKTLSKRETRKVRLSQILLAAMAIIMIVSFVVSLIA